MGARADRARGRLKEAWGGLTDNKRLKDKGRADTATGTAKKKTGRRRQGQEHAGLEGPKA